MNKLQIDRTIDLYKIISFLKSSEENDICLEFLSDSVIHKNASNINVIKKYSVSLGKSVNFETADPQLAEYLKMVDEGGNEFHNHPVNFDDEIDASLVNQKKSILSLGSFGFIKNFRFPAFGASSANNLKTNSDSKPWIIKTLIFVTIVLIFLGIGIWSFFVYVPKAKIKLSVDSDIFIKLIDVRADASISEVSLENNTIPAKEVTAEESDTKTIETTGTKQVGERATGEISVTNKKDEKVKIKKGTKFKVKNDDKTLTYLATEDEEIASAEEIADTKPEEEGDQPGTVYGKKAIKVEAEIFGEEYNLDEGKDFDVEGHDKDDLYGKNEKKIDGGSSKEVKSVVQADLDLLKKTLEETIKDKFKGTLKRQLPTGQVLSEGSIVITPVKAEYTAKLDDETDSIGLTVTYSAKAFSYNESDLNKIIDDNIAKVIPDNFKLSTEKPEYDAIPVKSTEDGVLNIQVKLKSLIVPNLDLDKIKGDLTGMKLEEAQNYLNSLPNIQETEIELTPNLPAPLLRMPRRATNIEINM